MRTTIVIGGGPAGMLAAGTAARQGERVLLIEKNPMLGKKLRITGKGRCNITNACEIQDMLGNIPTNHKFLYSALYTFTNDDIVRLLEDMGVKTKVERGARVFPVSDNAHDVAEALRRYALHPNTRLIRDEVKSLVIRDGVLEGVKTAQKQYSCDRVIMATGGASYPGTGSTGDGYRLAQQAGHTVIPPKPSLIPIVTREDWPSEVMGLSLKNIELSVYRGRKKIYTDFGEMLFTHFGVSGPVILSASAHMRKIETEEYVLSIDLKPALTMEKLDKRLLSDFEKYAKKHLINGLDDLLPKALIPVVIREAGLDPHKEISFITREERHSLAETLKGLRLHAKEFRPVSEAIVTSGGVKVGEIDPSTMESKCLKGLFFAGELIDVDAYTGGFNLQIAYSTGYLAGISGNSQI